MLSGIIVKVLSIALLIAVGVVLILGIDNLEPYFDNPSTLAKIFSLRGLPTTIILNAEREEFARIIGSINFDDENFINWLKNLN